MALPAQAEDITAVVERWLDEFRRALGAHGDTALGALFQADSCWRDVLALTWRIRTVSGLERLVPELKARAAAARVAAVAIDRERAAPREVTRAGAKAIEAILRFETAMGRCSGVLRLTRAAAEEGFKAWTLFTMLDELKGFEERVGRRRPGGHSYSREFRGPNWLDLRKSDAAYADREPAVLIVGGGHAGLSLAARLRQLEVDALVIDRWPRVGDNWRRRYHALTLHNQVHVNHLPYLHFPPNWPVYIPKDKIAGWLESYVEAMELNYWTGTEFQGAAMTRHRRAGQ